MALAASAYVQRGWLVFPCGERSKKPATPNGCKDATIDQQRIVAYWARRPLANVAIATGPASGIWVLDIDQPDGLDSLSRLERKNAPLPTTLTQRTGSGGLQMFWRWPTDRDIRNSAGRLGSGLDTRGAGGYVVAPPSIHPDTGNAYAWLDGNEDGTLNDLVVISPAPGWLLDLVAPATPPVDKPGPTPASAKRAPDGIAGILATVAAQVEGSRNSVLYWGANRLQEKAVPQADAEAMLTPIAQAIGLAEAEAVRTIASAYGGVR